MPASTASYDMVVVGGGTGGCFAAATAARAGLDVALLERKTAAEAGRSPVATESREKFVPRRRRQRADQRRVLHEPEHSPRNLREPQKWRILEIPFGQTGAVVDRLAYGQVLLDETDRAGAEIHYETVVNDVVQPNGTVTGVTAVRGGDPSSTRPTSSSTPLGHSPFCRTKPTSSTFDTNVNYSQFCSAYREVLEVPDPVEWDDALVFKPTKELGYLWYFPRSSTEINAGLGFQMTQEPVELVDVLKDDIANRSEFAGATVKNKLGAALPTRRPYDSAVHAGYVAVGDAAGHVNPVPAGNPRCGESRPLAAQVAIDAISDGDVSEAALWEYNQRVQTDFGKRFAAMDLYNIFGTAHELDELVSIITALPGQQLVDAIGKKGTADMGLGLKLKTLAKTFGHWDVLYELYKVQNAAGSIKDVYDSYPASPDHFSAWQSERDGVLEQVYEVTGAEPKY